MEELLDVAGIRWQLVYAAKAVFDAFVYVFVPTRGSEHKRNHNVDAGGRLPFKVEFFGDKEDEIHFVASRPLRDPVLSIEKPTLITGEVLVRVTFSE